MTLAAYTGHEPLTFPDYLDLDTGRTLSAEPGRTYDITPASGRMVPDIPAGWFIPSLMPRVGTWLGVSRELTDTDVPAEGDGTPADSAEAGEEPAGEPE